MCDGLVNIENQRELDSIRSIPTFRCYIINITSPFMRTYLLTICVDSI